MVNNEILKVAHNYEKLKTNRFYYSQSAIDDRDQVGVCIESYWC